MPPFNGSPLPTGIAIPSTILGAVVRCHLATWTAKNSTHVVDGPRRVSSSCTSLSSALCSKWASNSSAHGTGTRVSPRSGPNLFGRAIAQLTPVVKVPRLRLAHGRRDDIVIVRLQSRLRGT